MDDQARTVWSYWDLWFCLVALADHAGDLDALSEAIENGGRTLGGGTVESKLSQAHPTSTKPPARSRVSPPLPTIGSEGPSGTPAPSSRCRMRRFRIGRMH